MVAHLLIFDIACPIWNIIQPEEISKYAILITKTACRGEDRLYR